MKRKCCHGTGRCIYIAMATEGLHDIFNLYFNYWVQFFFLKLLRPLTFFDYAVFWEIEIWIETRAVSLFPEKKSNNLWSPSYVLDLIKSLTEVTGTAIAETRCYFLYMKSMSLALEARQRYLLFMVDLCVSVQKSKT